MVCLIKQLYVCMAVSQGSAGGIDRVTRFVPIPDLLQDTKKLTTVWTALQDKVVTSEVSCCCHTTPAVPKLATQTSLSLRRVLYSNNHSSCCSPHSGQASEHSGDPAGKLHKSQVASNVLKLQFQKGFCWCDLTFTNGRLLNRCTPLHQAGLRSALSALRTSKSQHPASHVVLKIWRCQDVGTRFCGQLQRQAAD